MVASKCAFASTGGPAESSVVAVLSFFKQRLEVERPGKHLNFTFLVARPSVFGPVPIKLDAVAVGIAEIKSFGDAVVGGAFERDFCVDETAQGASQLDARGI